MFTGPKKPKEKKHECIHQYTGSMEQIKVLQSEIIELKNIITELKKNQTLQTSSSKSPDKVEEFFTDEDELEKEIGGWEDVTNKRKRKKLSSPLYRTKEVLKTQNESVEIINQNVEPKMVKPPPIYVEEIENQQTFSEKLKTLIPDNNFTLKKVGKTKIKIKLENENDYRTARNKLTNDCNIFYTYENKLNRPIRVLMKGIDSTWPIEDILIDLKNQGFKAINAINKQSWKDKVPLDMFIVEFDNSENIDKIYGIKKVLNYVVEICPLKGSKLVPQCKKCQKFGHTKRYCERNPKCVKCAGDHLTALCDKPREFQVLCANCEGPHPANYRGCLVAKTLQNIRQKKNQNENKEHYKPIKPPKINNLPLEKLKTQTKTQPINFDQAGPSEYIPKRTYSQICSLVKANKQQEMNDIVNLSKAVKSLFEQQSEIRSMLLELLIWKNSFDPKQ